MKKFINSLINKISFFEQEQRADIGTKEFGEKYCFLIFDKTKQYFDNHQLMENLGIKKSNDSVSEIHILLMFSIFNCIKGLRFNSDMKNLIMDSILNTYTDFLIQYTKAKGIDEEILFDDSDRLVKLIFKRFGQYNEIFKRYTIEASKNDSTGGDCGELERGNDLIKILNHITSHRCDDKNPFPSIYFFSFFMNLMMDEQIRNSMNSDVNSYLPVRK